MHEYLIVRVILLDSSKITLPFKVKDQVAANAVRKQLRDLSHKIGPTLQPVFVSF